MERMKPFWTDRSRWLRIALVASGVWLGGVVIASQVAGSSFRWFPYSYRNNYDFGPAGITAFVGVAVIYILCIGIPWIVKDANKKAGD
jgi:cellulose synthase/poly-beta-1,6-N-acetylglucosamine synthase-like glycosyltransferase